MDLIDGITDLLHDKGNPCLGERLWFFKLVIELSACPHLQNNVDVDAVVKTAVHLYDVGMIKEHLNFDLSSKLVSNFLFMQ